MLFRLWELRRGWLWCDRDTGRPVSFSGADFADLRAWGLIVKRTIAEIVADPRL